MNNYEQLKEKLFYEPKNAYEKLSEKDKASMNAYAEDYKVFLNNSKTEREAVISSIKLAEEKGFKEYKFGDKIKAGDKYYYNNRGKSLYLFVIGQESLENGVRIAAAHVDSPRLDLKQNPIYEDNGMAFFKTHYYGGIKKYQWTAIPLALHGTVMLADGKTVDICIGEDESDPVLYVNDLLPHLAGDQMQKKASEVISGEALNLLIGSEPISNDGISDAVKLNVLNILNEKYGITEADFISAELCAVPAGKARDVGLDRSMICSYGHDDRVCAYPAVTAIINSDKPKSTLMSILADKEEIGSEGNSGMQCEIFVDLLRELAEASGSNYSLLKANSKCLSADVNAAFDPNFAEVFEKKNASFINRGVVMTKYTGARGKSSTSDASAEFVGYVRNIFDKAGVVWQTGELGKVDIGGGGTVAKYIAKYNIDTVDLGVAVISMHAPYEVIAKADLYNTYLGIKAFFEF